MKVLLPWSSVAVHNWPSMCCWKRDSSKLKIMCYMYTVDGQGAYLRWENETLPVTIHTTARDARFFLDKKAREKGYYLL